MSTEEMIVEWIKNNWLSILNSVIMIGIPFYLKKNIECAFARKAEEHKANLDIIKNKSNEFSKLEIEVIKNSWDKFIDVYYAFNELAAALKRYPDVKTMTDREIELYLIELNVNNENIETVLSSYDKQNTLQNVIEFTKANNVLNLLFEFTKYIDKNSIFMRKDIRYGFDVMYKEMKMVSYKYREYIRTKIEKTSDIYIELHNLLKKITELKEEAELEIQKIVFPEKISR